MKTQKELKEIASNKNPYKVSAPYGDETRGYKQGFTDGYEYRNQELEKERMSDEELRKMIEDTYEPNMVRPDTEALMDIAKKYADIKK